MWTPTTIAIGLVTATLLVACGTDWKVARRDAGATDSPTLAPGTSETETGFAGGSAVPAKDPAPSGSSSSQSSEMYRLTLRLAGTEPSAMMSSSKYAIALGRRMEAL
ncbi:MAG: hypothetical protein RL385_1623 [Pseudomonadota bacterium]|jgi:hypothetical protein